MFDPKPKKKINVPPALTGLIENTRPLADGTLRRLERKISLVKEMHAAAASDAERAERFRVLCALGSALIRQRALRAAVERIDVRIGIGADPAEMFRILCVAAAGALHRHAVDDLRGFLSVVHATGVTWPRCDTPAPIDALPALKSIGVACAEELITTPAPEWLAIADKLRGADVRGAAFAALAAEGLGAAVAEGRLTEAEARSAWAERPLWRPGELETLVSYC